jgi:DNA processing protein
LDELSWRTGIGVNKLASILLEMEFSGFVKSLPGKKYSSRN